jgi:hypothetical protein
MRRGQRKLSSLFFVKFHSIAVMRSSLSALVVSLLILTLHLMGCANGCGASGSNEEKTDSPKSLRTLSEPVGLASSAVRVGGPRKTMRQMLDEKAAASASATATSAP